MLAKLLNKRRDIRSCIRVVLVAWVLCMYPTYILVVCTEQGVGTGRLYEPKEGGRLCVVEAQDVYSG